MNLRATAVRRTLPGHSSPEMFPLFFFKLIAPPGWFWEQRNADGFQLSKFWYSNLKSLELEMRNSRLLNGTCQFYSASFEKLAFRLKDSHHLVREVFRLKVLYNKGKSAVRSMLYCFSGDLMKQALSMLTQTLYSALFGLH